jgi:hypothetical protein
MDMEMTYSQPKRAFRFQVLVAGVTAILVVGYVSFLLISYYRSQVDLQKNLLKQMQQESEKQALAVGYFFNERNDDLVNLSRSREVAAFFESKDLGMSMEYGLKLSLIPIQERFVDLINQKSLNGEPIYSRILFIEKNGQVLVDSATGPKKDKAIDGKELLLRIVEGETAFSSADGREIMVSASYTFKKKYAGQLVGYIRPEVLYKNLLREGTPSQRYTFLSIEKAGTYLSVGDFFSPHLFPRDLGKLTAGSVRFLEKKEILGQVQKRIALRLPVKNTPFSMIVISDAQAVLGNVEP